MWSRSASTSLWASVAAIWLKTRPCHMPTDAIERAVTSTHAKPSNISLACMVNVRNVGFI